MEVTMGGLGQTEVQRRNTRAVLWFLGITAVVTVGGIMLWKAQ
jgi:hypothetical protein